MTETRIQDATNPILFEPWEEPDKHWDFSANQLSPELKYSRRPSQPSVALGRLGVNIPSNSEPYRTINLIRKHVADWRKDGYPGSSARKLLSSWHDRSVQDEGDERPFFCQREAVETLAWLFTCKHDSTVQEIWNHLSNVNNKWNDGLNRIAIKMATGTGKTRTMAMFQAVLSTMHPEGCQILIITPNLTVQERLEELHSLQDERSIVPVDCPRSSNLQIINFQKFRRQDNTFSGLDGYSKLHRDLLKNPVQPESYDQMFDRLIETGEKELPLYVFQDEGHHCRRDQVKNRNLIDDEIDDKGQWYKTLLELRKNRELEAIIDFSATPSYLEKPTQLASPLFPWCITDFSVEDAQESGICKIARLPFKPDEKEELDKRFTGIYEFCQNKGQPPKWGDKPPPDVQEIFKLLAADWVENRLPAYQNYNRTPALIAVVDRVHNAKVLYQWLAGTREGDQWKPGAIDEFSNIDKTKLQPKTELPTLVVHSHINDSDEINTSSKQVVDEQTELRAPNKSRPEALKKIRETFQTVGVKGELGEKIRCVISVAMLSEGWDAKTVTHVFGFRKFSSLLLCEQVIGRALRRPSLDDPDTAEYAEIIGIPYPGLIAIVGPDEPKGPTIAPYRIFSVKEHEFHRLHWPKIKAIHTKPAEGNRFKLDPLLVKEWYSTIPNQIVVKMKDPLWRGQSIELRSDLFRERNNKVLYKFAKLLSDKWFFNHSGDSQIFRRGVLFIDALTAVSEWCVHPLIRIYDLSVLHESSWQDQLIEEVATACVNEDGAKSTVEPVWQNSISSKRETFSDTGGVDFETTLRHRYPEIENLICDKSELNRAACHSQSEAEISNWLDSSSLVRHWVRNFRLGWRIPWWDPVTVQWREYEPDFLVELESEQKCYVVIEMKGIENENSMNKALAAERWCKLVSDLEHQQCKGDWKYLLVSKPEELNESLQTIRSNYVSTTA